MECYIISCIQYVLIIGKEQTQNNVIQIQLQHRLIYHTAGHDPLMMEEGRSLKHAGFIA